MKMDRNHIVPLSRQAIEVFERAEPITGSFMNVFPKERSRTRAMSDNGIESAVRTLGFTIEEMTPHGFRAMARTFLDEELRFDLTGSSSSLHTVCRSVGSRLQPLSIHP